MNDFDGNMEDVLGTEIISRTREVISNSLDKIKSDTPFWEFNEQDIKNRLKESLLLEVAPIIYDNSQLDAFQEFSQVEIEEAWNAIQRENLPQSAIIPGRAPQTQVSGTNEGIEYATTSERYVYQPGRQRRESNIFGLISIVFGFVGCCCYLSFLGAIFGVIGIIFGALGKSRDQKPNLSTLGIFLGVFSITCSIVSMATLFLAIPLM